MLSEGGRIRETLWYQGGFWFCLVAGLVFWARGRVRLMHELDPTFLVVLVASLALAVLLAHLVIRGRARFQLYASLVYFSLFLGIFSFVRAFFPLPAALTILALAGLLLAASPRVLAQNAVLSLALVGIVTQFSATIPLSLALLLVVGLCFYDLVAVRVTHAMVRLAHQVVRVHLPVVYVLPVVPGGIFEHVRRFSPGANAVFFGAGDIALPAVLVGAAPSRTLALGALFGSLAGLFVLAYYFGQDRKHAPLPALPFLVGGAVLGLFVAIIS